MKIHKQSVPLRLPRSRILVVVLLVIVLMVLFITLIPSHVASPNLTHYLLPDSKPSAPTRRIPDPRLKCIKVAYGLSSEGIGAIIKRTQAAIFLASWNDVPIQFPVKESIHGYAYHELFGLCPGEKKHPPHMKKIERGTPCSLFTEDLIVNFCPRGDCQCLHNQLRPIIEPLLASGCSVLSFRSNSEKTLGYSGCLGPTLNKYFVGSMPRPKYEYDVIHYRMGDLAHVGGGKSFRPTFLNYLMKAMCKRSNRDIIILTEGSPAMPECGNRRVLAGDTTIQEAFQIFKYARHVGVGPSSFAIAMMDVAEPERIFVSNTNVRMHEWKKCENWTIITKGGTVLDFDSRELMLQTVFTRDLTDHTRRSPGQIENDKIFNTSVPARKWTINMMRP